MNPILKKSYPHILALAVFLVLCITYFTPQLSGHLLQQHDIEQYIAMSKEIVDYRDKFDEEPLWTNSTFAGMPAYQVSLKSSNLINTIKSFILRIIPRPIGYIFLSMIGFYILLLCFNINFKIAALGAIAFGLASYNLLYLMAGHNAKVHALSFVPPLIGSILYAYRKNMLKGAALFSVFICLQLSANHLQITYYSIYLIAAIAVVELVNHFKTNQLPKFVKVSAFLLLAGVIGILPTFSNLFVTKEYSEYTIRGKSDLTINSKMTNDENANKEALNIDYIKEYSLGKGEVWSVVIPNVKGGRSQYIGNDRDLLKSVDPAYRQSIAQMSGYWGEQNSSGGTFYYGASVFLLFVLGLFLLKDNIKWGILAVSILALFISMKYSNVLDFFIKHVPLFDKFRDTKMMLVLVQVSMPLLGFAFINKLLKGNGVIKKHFLYVSGGLGLLFLLFYMMPTTWFDFLSSRDKEQFDALFAQAGNNPRALDHYEGLQSALIDARILIYKKDVMRSLLFIVITAALIYLFLNKKIKENTFVGILAVVIIVDLWGVGKRYLNNEKQGSKYLYWVDAFDYRNPFKAQKADLDILAIEQNENPEIQQTIDQEISKIGKKSGLKASQREIEQEKIAFRELNFSTGYRVYDISTGNPFASSRTCYYHKSLGGYHGAKLRKFQELVDFYLYNERAEIIKALQNNPTRESIMEVLREQTPVMNMLNTKYVIYNPAASPIVNPYKYGNAWFVDEVILAENADSAILNLKNITSNKAVVNIENKDYIPTSLGIDSTAEINLTRYRPNHLTYESVTESEQLAVFSEIYYDRGWNAYIDGQKVDYIKANYTLRALQIPGGRHTIEFKFEPQSYYKGRKISVAGSGLIVLFLTAALFFDYKKKKQKTD